MEVSSQDCGLVCVQEQQRLAFRYGETEAHRDKEVKQEVREGQGQGWDAGVLAASIMFFPLSGVRVGGSEHGDFFPLSPSPNQPSNSPICSLASK